MLVLSDGIWCKHSVIKYKGSTQTPQHYKYLVQKAVRHNYTNIERMLYEAQIRSVFGSNIDLCQEFL